MKTQGKIRLDASYRERHVSFLFCFAKIKLYIHLYWSLRVTVDFLYNLTINSRISSMYLFSLWIPNSIFLGVMLVLSEMRFRKLMSRRWESKVPNLGFFKKAITQNYFFIFFFLRSWNLAIFDDISNFCFARWQCMSNRVTKKNHNDFKTCVRAQKMSQLNMPFKEYATVTWWNELGHCIHAQNLRKRRLGWVQQYGY